MNWLAILAPLLRLLRPLWAPLAGLVAGWWAARTKRKADEGEAYKRTRREMDEALEKRRSGGKSWHDSLRDRTKR